MAAFFFSWLDHDEGRPAWSPPIDPRHRSRRRRLPLPVGFACLPEPKDARAGIGSSYFTLFAVEKEEQDAGALVADTLQMLCALPTPEAATKSLLQYVPGGVMPDISLDGTRKNVLKAMQKLQTGQTRMSAYYISLTLRNSSSSRFRNRAFSVSLRHLVCDDGCAIPSRLCMPYSSVTYFYFRRVHERRAAAAYPVRSKRLCSSTL